MAAEPSLGGGDVGDVGTAGFPQPQRHKQGLLSLEGALPWRLPPLPVVFL